MHQLRSVAQSFMAIKTPMEKPEVSGIASLAARNADTTP